MDRLPEKDDTPEFLALRALKLGDLLVAVPALHAIRRSRPDHRLVLAVPGWLEPVAELVGGIDVLWPTPGLDHPLGIEPGRIDTAMNLHGDGPESRGVLEQLQPRVRLGHASPGWDGPEWEDHVLERHRWARLASEHGMPADQEDVGIARPDLPSAAPGAVVVHVGAFYGSRHWPVDRFATVVRELREEGRRVVLTGSEKERPRALEVAALAGLDDEVVAADVLAGTVDLAEMAAVVADASVVVSVDTGAAHLASAYATPSVVLFGPAPPEEWGPPASGPHVVLTDASLRVGDTFGTECDPALLAVQPADVLAAAREVARSLDGIGA
ncbi:glycosyltransferase family 9 protein [Frigoribacterium sp. PhB116]|uniref:glycosyltransferase family 9 protein n=1 Tax=Frigoribacterium sp. PhB116 TaxID=2485174 RepID=UPI00105FC3BC|nr:glycosyltransferase family 9 protein [Frigoribacterium sp. PhB116]TDT63170.1 ADP-heptose:LPS heptosyltransferase [Frigoribacterium sp. PhB116]